MQAVVNSAHSNLRMGSVIQLVNENQIESLAIPAIGAGVFKCPPELSAEMTARVLAHYQQHGTSLRHVRVWASTQALKEVFEQVIKANRLSHRAPGLVPALRTQ